MKKLGALGGAGRRVLSNLGGQKKNILKIKIHYLQSCRKGTKKGFEGEGVDSKGKVESLKKKQMEPVGGAFSEKVAREVGRNHFGRWDQGQEKKVEDGTAARLRGAAQKSNGKKV